MVSSFFFNPSTHHFAGDEDTNISRRATLHWYMRYAEMVQRQKRITKKKLRVDVNQDEIFEYTGHSLNEEKDIDVDTILRKCKVC